MKWTAHTLISSGVVYLASGDWLSAFAAGLGAVFPDWLEFRIYGKYDKRVHRKWTHWIGWYLPVIVWVLFFQKGEIKLGEVWACYYESGLWGDLMLLVFFWVCVGSILHVFEDSLTGKVPLFSPGKRDFGWKLFLTGSIFEKVLAALVFAVCVLLRGLLTGKFF